MKTNITLKQIENIKKLSVEDIKTIKTNLISDLFKLEDNNENLGLQKILNEIVNYLENITRDKEDTIFYSKYL